MISEMKVEENSNKNEETKQQATSNQEDIVKSS